MNGFSANLLLTYELETDSFVWRDFLINYYNKTQVDAFVSALNDDIVAINEDLQTNYYTGTIVDTLLAAKQNDLLSSLDHSQN